MGHYTEPTFAGMVGHVANRYCPDLFLLRVFPLKDPATAVREAS